MKIWRRAILLRSVKPNDQPCQDLARQGTAQAPVQHAELRQSGETERGRSPNGRWAGH
jgi:hypothetical protein